MKQPLIDPYLTLTEAAEVSGYHPKTLRKFVNQRELTVSRRGQRGHMKIRLSELERWMRSNEVRRSTRSA